METWRKGKVNLPAVSTVGRHYRRMVYRFEEQHYWSDKTVTATVLTDARGRPAKAFDKTYEYRQLAVDPGAHAIQACVEVRCNNLLVEARWLPDTQCARERRLDFRILRVINLDYDGGRITARVIAGMCAGKPMVNWWLMFWRFWKAPQLLEALRIATLKVVSQPFEEPLYVMGKTIDQRWTQRIYPRPRYQTWKAWLKKYQHYLSLREMGAILRELTEIERQLHLHILNEQLTSLKLPEDLTHG